MIITRTPFRISFFGGGTDYPEWYENKGTGSVINCSINKYCYIITRYLPPFFDYNYRIRYYLKEEVQKINSIKHPVIRETLRNLNFQNEKIEIVHNADLPAQCGLGTSSAFTVGLTQALNGLRNIRLSKNRLAMNAIRMEQKILKENVGSQDQVIAAMGGLNYITFKKNNNISVKKILMSNENNEIFHKSMVLVFTKLQRNANDIAKEQILRTKNNLNDKYLYQMSDLTKEANKKLFNSKKFDIKNFGTALSEQWELKKKLSNNISNKRIDEIYKIGIENGAIGGKLLGAGNGGFILFIVNKKNRGKLIKKFKNVLHVPFKIDRQGSKIIYFKRS